MKPRPIAEMVAEYLSHRRALGFTLAGVGDELGRFARFADSQGHRGHITTELCVRWAQHVKGGSRYVAASRYSCARGLSRYMAGVDPGTEVPPAGLLGPHSRRAKPHIYTDGELRSLCQAATKLPPTGGLRSHTYDTLFALLAATGIRVREALRLRKDDVDLTAGLVRILRTKGHLGRHLPLHRSAVEGLRRYAKRRDEYHRSRRPCEAFFLTERGTALCYELVTRCFRELRSALGWAGTPPPRIHDLRHTFAVRNLLRWMKEGADVNGKMLILSSYLGHVNPSNTYWYLSAVPELMELTSRRFESYACPGALR